MSIMKNVSHKEQRVQTYGLAKKIINHWRLDIISKLVT